MHAHKHPCTYRNTLAHPVFLAVRVQVSPRQSSSTSVLLPPAAAAARPPALLAARRSRRRCRRPFKPCTHIQGRCGCVGGAGHKAAAAAGFACEAAVAAWRRRWWRQCRRTFHAAIPSARGTCWLPGTMSAVPTRKSIVRWASVPISGVARPWEEALICTRCCRDRCSRIRQGFARMSWPPGWLIFAMAGRQACMLLTLLLCCCLCDLP